VISAAGNDDRRWKMEAGAGIAGLKIETSNPRTKTRSRGPGLGALFRFVEDWSAMRGARAILTLSLLVSAAVAQSVSLAHLQIAVQDATGASISGAHIEVEASPEGQNIQVRTDREGRVGLDVLPGSYGIAVRSAGFRVWRGKVVARATPNPSILVVTLDIGPTGNPVVIEDESLKPAVERAPVNAAIAAPEDDKVRIRTAHDSAPELATKAQVEHLLAAYDARQWAFTHEVGLRA
jgi:hypothetical protein